ncbi:tyrosine-type recombinase/integrase [Lentilactobacillus senioris]|uniref:tyrosine-type recombinase/integrase n=1 Tax=Lentilactobacillus senioris TaxID=931534 RepID=UPI002280717C|nr:tyrosine-type recombinase/integrase [Lentilactobacillus senioris]MCY9807492.1 tyrosine-type recombinase/integrase [Lentilactobacillus senioris]
MANIKKTSTGYKARVSYVDPSGTRKERSKSRFRTLKEAKAWTNELENSINNEVNIVDNRQTLPEYFLKWFETFKKGKVALITEKEYLWTYKVLLNYFPTTSLENMSRAKFQRFINDFAYGTNEQRVRKNIIDPKEQYHSKASVEKIFVHTHSAISDAVIDGLIPRDFTSRIELTGHAPKSSELKYLDADDMFKLSAEMERNISLSSTGKTMIYTALLTGARYSEIAALTWQDVDWDNKTIEINKSWDYVFGGGFKAPKTKSSYRTILVDDSLLRVFKILRSLQMAQTKFNNPNHLIFLNDIGTIPSSSAVNKLLRKSHDNLGIKEITFHGLRHTHASYLLYQGVKMEYISKRLGHRNSNVTRKIYAHLIKEDEDAESEKAISVLRKLSSM